jgi:hypothetical protein
LNEKNIELNSNLKNISSRKKSLLLLLVIFVAGLIIRFTHVPYDIPLTLDGFGGYFLYTLDITRLEHLPNYTLSQSGWGEFLSLFFTIFHSDHFMDYMNLQRTVSVIISGITVIPIYLICRKFFSSNYSLIGALIFAFEPRIIINSTLGISEPLYILAITLGILFFINSNKIINYLSFAFLAWATIIRPEGQFWFVAFAIVYFIRFRKNRKDCALFLLCLAVFLLVLSPIVIHRMECCGDDAIIGRILAEIWQYENSVNYSNGIDEIKSYGPNFESGIKLLGWSLLPVFIIFLPPGILVIIRERSYPNYLLIIIPIILSIPVLYSVSIAPDTRYVYPLFPIFCVIVLFGIRWIKNNFQNEKIILTIIIISIIISSLIFLEYKKIDYTNDLEAYQIAKLIENKITGINGNTDVRGFLIVAEFSEIWSNTKMNNDWYAWHYEDYKSKIISSNGNTLEEYINNAKESNLSHIIIDDSKNNPKYLIDLINNEKNYPYLIKEFNSNDFGFDYQVIMYKIDYERFKEL